MTTSNYSSNTLSALRNTSTSGNISFASKVDFAAGTSPFPIGIGDLNGDGKPDLTIASSGGIVNNMPVLQNTSTSGSITLSSLHLRYCSQLYRAHTQSQFAIWTVTGKVI